MIFTVTFALLLAFAAASPVDQWRQWEDYKLAHGKFYASFLEDRMRAATFFKNIARVQTHNEEAANGVHTYTLALNKFADWTTEEFQRRNGYKSALKKPAPELFTSDLEVSKLPKTVDWRPKGYVTPVKDQKQCGSCWAFSAVASLEGQHFRATKKLVSLSEQNLVDCSGPEGNEGCDGGLMDQGFDYIIKNKGIDTEKSYPYKAEDGDCKFSKKKIGATMKSYVDIESGSEKDLQKAAATIGPISVAIDASQDSFQLYSEGVYNEEDCSTEQLDHGVTVVGYGTEKGQEYWLVKNSWGGDWGEKGYIKMSRNKDNQCGIATQASYPKV